MEVFENLDWLGLGLNIVGVCFLLKGAFTFLKALFKTLLPLLIGSGLMLLGTGFLK